MEYVSALVELAQYPGEFISSKVIASRKSQLIFAPNYCTIRVAWLGCGCVTGGGVRLEVIQRPLLSRM